MKKTTISNLVFGFSAMFFLLGLYVNNMVMQNQDRSQIIYENYFRAAKKQCEGNGGIRKFDLNKNFTCDNGVTFNLEPYFGNKDKNYDKNK